MVQQAKRPVGRPPKVPKPPVPQSTVFVHFGRHVSIVNVLLIYANTYKIVPGTVFQLPNHGSTTASAFFLTNLPPHAISSADHCDEPGAQTSTALNAITQPNIPSAPSHSYVLPFPTSQVLEDPVIPDEDPQHEIRRLESIDKEETPELDDVGDGCQSFLYFSLFFYIYFAFFPFIFV